jgi:hypothetical protein
MEDEMTTRVDMMRLDKTPPTATTSFYPHSEYGTFVTLELRCDGDAVVYYLPGSCAEWARNVAAAINTPALMVEVAA